VCKVFQVMPEIVAERNKQPRKVSSVQNLLVFIYLNAVS
jgi:hypothetical protein